MRVVFYRCFLQKASVSCSKILVLQLRPLLTGWDDRLFLKTGTETQVELQVELQVVVAGPCVYFQLVLRPFTHCTLT